MRMAVLTVLGGDVNVGTRPTLELTGSPHIVTKALSHGLHIRRLLLLFTGSTSVVKLKIAHF